MKEENEEMSEKKYRKKSQFVQVILDYFENNMGPGRRFKNINVVASFLDLKYSQAERFVKVGDNINKFGHHLDQIGFVLLPPPDAAENEQASLMEEEQPQTISPEEYEKLVIENTMLKNMVKSQTEYISAYLK